MDGLDTPEEGAKERAMQFSEEILHERLESQESNYVMSVRRIAKNVLINEVKDRREIRILALLTENLNFSARS